MRRAQELTNKYLEFLEVNQFKSEPANLYGPIDYIMSLGGKRMRPTLALLAHDTIVEPSQHALELAHAVELFHNFTLMHDDIMDEAPIRRGKQSVHEKWDTATAILSGDLMLIKTYQRLSNIRDIPQQVLTDFNIMAEEVCKGQQLDMDFENLDDVELAEYLQMIDWKTAVLLAFSLKAGALLADASQSEADHFYHVGMKIGRGFQLMDDYLDAFGDEEKFGKQVGGDIIEGKKTYLVLRTLEKLNGDALEEFKSLFDLKDDTEKVRAVKLAFENHGITQEIKAEIESCFDEAASLLDRIPLQTEHLKEYIRALAGRDH